MTRNPGTGEGIVSTEITRLGVVGNIAMFEGRCVTLSGERCVFGVFLQDNGSGERGPRDIFQISVNGRPYRGGNLSSGDITITR